MSKTSHCVCSPNLSSITSPVKVTSNDMPSPPLPPRTLRANLSPTKNKWEPPNCTKEKIQCNCNRPHSCPAQESSPPIPPKCNAQNYNKSKHQINKRFEEQIIGIQKEKCHESHRVSRKSGRHNSSDGGKTRKKSRSKSRSLAKDEVLQGIKAYDDDRFFAKKHDNLIDKNSETFFRSNKEFAENNIKLCKISENNETTLNLCSNSSNVTKNSIPQNAHPPDLIPNRSNSEKVTNTTAVLSTDNSQKSNSKSRMKKIFGFLSKTKKTSEPNRTTTVTPDAMQSLPATDINGRPRRSKSLHLITSLSPTTSMHAKHDVISPKIKAKSSSIFAVISPTTTRLKRNFLCISPKTSNTNKKPIGPLSVATNSKSILSDNSQQRPVLASMSGMRISPVHLLSSNNVGGACCHDKDSNPIDNHYGASHFIAGPCGDGGRTHSTRLDLQEKTTSNENEVLMRTSSSFKAQGHQDCNQRKTPLSSNEVNRQPIGNNSQNPHCSCYSYRPNDIHCPRNNVSYHHVCPSQCIVPPCSRCMHNIVQLNTKHFHSCHNNQQVWCWVPCYPEQVPVNQHSFCSCQLYNHSASPPPNFLRQLPPPPPPPPPVPSFSNNHQFSRRYRQSYSKTPPPSFHTHQLPQYHDDHCYQDYNFTKMSDSRQKMIVSHHQITVNACHSNCCNSFQNQSCCVQNHSKCSACGSIFHDDFGAEHYNMNDMHQNQCSNADFLFDKKLMSQNRMLVSSINANEECCNCHCIYNHSCHRHSETCGRHSNEFRIHSCINSVHRSSIQPYGVVDRERPSSKHRKNSSNSCHGANIDPDNEEKHGMSRTHHNSPAITTSIHMSPEINANCDMTISTNNNNNNSNVSNNINTMMTSSSNIIQNDKKQQQFEPWRKTFHDNMMALRNLGWYWGPLNHLEAENLVQGRPDGTFLVRDSGNEAYFLSLTFRVLGTTYHTRIEYSQGKFSFWSQPESHSATTIVEFIDKAVAHSVSGKFHYFLQTNTPGQPPMEVSLLYPLSRYQIVQSLEHLSRFVILSNIRRDHVSQLQLPPSMKTYLMEKQYYIDCIETFVELTKDSEPLTYEPSVDAIKNLK